VIDNEHNSSAEFSDLYIRLLNAVLDERNSTLSPRLREHYLAAHVAHGISMAGAIPGTVSEAYSKSTVIRSQGFGHGEPTLL
jgi:hypothetical protein